MMLFCSVVGVGVEGKGGVVVCSVLESGKTVREEVKKNRKCVRR